MKGTLAKTILTVLAVVLVSTSLNAAKKGKQSVSEKPPSQSLIDIQNQKKIARAHHLAEKSANSEFMNSPQGIGFKKQLAALDQEINAVYEKYLNIFREDPATEKGRKVHEERDRQIQLLKQKRKKCEADYEALKKTSPVYSAMVEKHLKSELGQLKGKLKSKPLEEEDGNP